MMNFDTAFTRLISHEGGYSDDPRDPGNWTGGQQGVGELKGTKYGIAANTYPDLDIKNLTLDQAKAIYYRDFWLKSGGDQLHPAIVYQLWDMAVNSGVVQARMKMQRAIGVAEDGHFGPITVAKIKSMDVSDVLLRFNAVRLDFYTDLSKWPVYGKGWTRRIAMNLRHAAEDN